MRYSIFAGRKLPMAKDTSENNSSGSSGAVGSVADNARPIEEALLGLRKLSTSLHSTLDIDQILRKQEGFCFIRENINQSFCQK